MTHHRSAAVATVLAACLGGAGAAHAETGVFEFLEFYKSTTSLSASPFGSAELVLHDDFANDNPALSDLRVDGTTNSYSFINALQPPVESGGRLTITADAANTSPTNAANGQPFYSTGVRLLTNVNEATLLTTGPLAGRHAGLARDTPWSVATVFFASLPSVGASYSLRLTDFGIGPAADDGNDVLQLSFANIAGNTLVRLIKQNFVTGTITVLDQQALALTPAITRIGLGLAHVDADSDVISAYYAYGDNNAPLTVVKLAGTGTIYDGEIHTRAEMRVSVPVPVPEPATWALWAGGLAALGAAARRRSGQAGAGAARG